MISSVNYPGQKSRGEGEPSPTEDLAALLRDAVARPLDAWRAVYESFSPVDVVTGQRRPRVPPPGADSRRAAVLVPVLLEPEGARLVYTVRRDDLQDHAGQISCPRTPSSFSTRTRWRRSSPSPWMSSCRPIPSRRSCGRATAASTGCPYSPWRGRRRAISGAP